MSSIPACRWLQQVHGGCWQEWWDDWHLLLHAKKYEVDQKSGFPFHYRRALEAHILYAKEGGKKPPLRFKLECINVLLAASATEPSAPTASDRFSCRHFPELITPTQSKQNPQKRCLVCTSNKKEKKANTNVEIVHTNFKIYHIEWDWTLIMNFFFPCTLIQLINKCKCYFSKIRGTSVNKTTIL